jgi:hypothetical protein
MNRLTALGLTLVVTLAVALGDTRAAEAGHLPGKTIILIGAAGLPLGETPWQVLKEQLALRGAQEQNVLEFSYAGGEMGADGTWQPAPGGGCEGYSKLSMLALRGLVGGLAKLRPDHEVFLVGYDTGGFVAMQSLWIALSGRDEPGIWENVSGAVSISGPVSGLSDARVSMYGTHAARNNCIDLSMLQWIKEIGDDPVRYQTSERRAGLAQQLGYKIGTFGNTIDCAYRYTSDDICPKVKAATPGGAITAALLLRSLEDERPTQFIKNAYWREYNVAQPVKDERIDNHRATLLSTQPMAEAAEFILSQTR